MAITLPSASPASGGEGGRRRAASLPDAGDVPQARIASDPGLRVPDFGQAARGLEDVGAAIGDVSDNVKRAVDKQQKLHDATKTTEAFLAFQKRAGEAFRDSQVEDDPARPGYEKDFNDKLVALAEEIGAGLKDVSPEAAENIRLRMLQSQQGFADSAGRLSLEAVQAKGKDAVAAIANEAAAGAAAHPDFLKFYLEDFGERMRAFDGTSTADQERDNKRAGRKDIILSALNGMVRQDRFEEAKELLESGRFDDDLTGPERSAFLDKAERRIDMMDRAALRRIEKQERDAEKEVKRQQSVKSAEMTQNIFDGEIGEPDITDALNDRTIDGPQGARLFKLLKAQETEEATEDNPATVLTFTREVEDGTLTTDAVIDAFADKQITRATMDRFRTEIGATPDDFIVKENRRMLRENVGGESGEFVVFSEDKTRLINDATEEYNQRTRGPNKEPPKDVREDIESRAAARRAPNSFFRPRFLVGEDNEGMDVAATKKAMLKARRAGKITRDQLTKELDLIKQIEAARQRR